MAPALGSQRPSRSKPVMLGETVQVKARGYWEQVWIRFKRDKLAISGGIFIVLLILVAFAGAPVAAHLLGHGPDDQFGGAVNPTTSLPVGPWSHVSELPYPGRPGHYGSTLFILGADDVTGRDEFLRLLYGAQVSLEVAVGATAIGMIIGVLMGAVAGFFGGWVDSVVSRLTEMVMAFPYLLFIIALASTVGDRLDNVTLGFLGHGVLTLILVLGLFSWFYPARIIRPRCSRCGRRSSSKRPGWSARATRIIRSHLLPHLVAPIIVYSTLVIAQNILAEAGLSFLGLGIKFPTASWGSLLSVGPKFYTTQPWLMVWPGVAVLLTTLAFNLLGDGMRDAFDPRSTR